MDEQTKQLEAEGRKTIEIMRTAFTAFGLSDEETAQKINTLVQHMQQSNGSFRFLRIRDVVYTIEVTGVRQVELHAMIGGQQHQSDKYRVKQLEKTLPNALAVVKELGVSVAYVSMPKKEAKPYAKMMREFGFTFKDLEDVPGAEDLIAYIVRLQ